MLSASGLLAELAALADTSGGWGAIAECCAQHATPWRRDTPGGHVTVSAVLVDPVRRELLVCEHPKFGRWMQLGGHLEDTDDSLRHAAARELAEEAGITVDPDAGVLLGVGVFPEVACPAGARSTHYDVRVLWFEPAQPVRASAEHTALGWMPLEAPWAPHDEDLAGICAQVLARLDGAAA